jgi:hypothetical protein
VLILSGGDIVEILLKNGLNSDEKVKDWLDKQVPR